jgi:hypothetical protein
MGIDSGDSLQPYLSFIIAGRSDNYGGDLHIRIQSFLRFLHYSLGGGAGLFEIVVCDWNPPRPGRLMRTDFDWSQFDAVRFVEVGPELHRRYAGDAKYPILDYVARNAAIRRARGTYVCVLNQDIYLSRGVADIIAQRRLQDGVFYRADRCDFHADFGLAPEAFERHMLAHTFIINCRHRGLFDPIALPVAEGTPMAQWPSSRPLLADEVTRPGPVAVSRHRSPAVLRQTFGPPEMPDPVKASQFQTIIGALGLHTNACGDFLLAPKAAFERVNGFIETSKFYMHTDCYGVVQLSAAGFAQALFINPCVIFHSDHSRADRLDRAEPVSYDEHQLRWLRIFMGEADFRLNDAGWGLARYDLPIYTLRHGLPV